MDVDDGKHSYIKLTAFRNVIRGAVQWPLCKKIEANPFNQANLVAVITDREEFPFKHQQEGFSRDRDRLIV